MARVEFNSYAEGDPRDATVINSIWTAFQTQSTSVGAENVRDEGLDDRVLAAGAVTDGFDAAIYGTSGGGWANFSNTAYATMVLGATTMTITNSGAGWAFAGNAEIRVRASVAFRYTYATNADPAQNSPIHFRLQYVTNLGASTPTDDTELVYQHDRQVARVPDDPGPGAGSAIYTTDYYGYYTMTYRIVGGGATTLNSISLQTYIQVAQTYQCEQAILQAIRFVRPG